MSIGRDRNRPVLAERDFEANVVAARRHEHFIRAVYLAGSLEATRRAGRDHLCAEYGRRVAGTPLVSLSSSSHSLIVP